MLTLIQFRHSPYNEKVRWALDIKNVVHERRSLLPGPHLGTVKALTGRTTTPVLIADGVAMDGSSRVIRWLEERYPEPKLLPLDPELRSLALEIERRFDDDLTPRIRRVVLDTLLRSPGYFAAVFGEGASWPKRFGYACVVPFAAFMVKKGNGITGPSSLEDGHRAAIEALDYVAERSSTTGYLAGDIFSIADLAAASALATIVRPVDSPMSSPRPVAAPFQALVDTYSGHAGARWVRRIYKAHRGASHDFDGPTVSSHR